MILGAGALIASAALLFLGTGLRPMWWAMWLAPLPILLIAPRIRAWPAFGISVLVWFLGGLNMWHYVRGIIEIPVVLVLLILIVPSCFFGLAVLLFRRFILRGAIWKASFAFPLLWVTYEYLNAVTSPHSTFGNLGYTQMNCLPVLQVVSLVGIWGISFCLFLLPATAAALLSKQESLTQRRRLAAVVSGFLVAVIGYGAWRLSSTPAPEHSVKVGLMAMIPENLFPRHDEAALQLLRAYADNVGSLTPQDTQTHDTHVADTQVIVLPEKIAVVSDEATAQVDALFEATAMRVKANIVVGLDRGTATHRFNEARMYSPEGTVAALYDKHHMIPRFEDVDQPGTTITTFDQPSGIWGIEICKDMDFPELSRQYGAKGVALLLVPAWDFAVDGWLHGRMAIMRGVESGFTIVRVAKQGLLTVSDDRGRVLADADATTAPFASLFATAPVRHSNTLYTKWGDWFAWLNILGLAAILLSGRKKRDPAGRPRRVLRITAKYTFPISC